jgi:prepilin-type N-terminal cleavage/methylation domain-containing protein
MRARRRGFTLIEIMGVVALLGILASISLNYFDAQVMRSKRVEAVLGLSMLWKAQLAYYTNNEAYAASFDRLDFSLTGGRLVNSTTYKGTRYTFQLAQPWGTSSFYAMATAQLDADAWPDVVELIEVRQ